MADLAGSTTHENLIAAFVQVCQASRINLWFAQQADVEGRPAAATLFRSVAEGQTGHALGHLEFLADVGDPLSGNRIGDTADNLDASIAIAEQARSEQLPAFAEMARAEGFDVAAEWFETIARDHGAHVERLRAESES